MTQEQAISLASTEWWKERTADDIVAFQLFESRLCMPFGEFHEAVEKALDHPVFTHEFAHPEHLQAEFLKEAPAKTFEEVLAMLPQDKTVLILGDPNA